MRSGVRPGEVVSDRGRPGGRVFKQVQHGDVPGGFLVGEPELGDVAADRRAELHLALLDQAHDRRRGVRLPGGAELEQRACIDRLLAHAVGAGKTYEMAASAMKLKETGLVRKSLVAVPNHMLEQFGREFLHLYPNARLLIAGKEDLARDRRKLLTAKIATGDWDAIVVTHSSFERIGMSSAFQEEFLKEQISEYRSLLIEAQGDSDKGRNIIKTLEKRIASFEDKLKELTRQDKKDDGLVFDDLGVDQLFIDEAHYFRSSPRRPRWTGSPVSRPRVLNALSTC